jgi:hypothetical protein
MYHYYPAPYGAIGALFAPRFLLQAQKKTVEVTQAASKPLPPLTSEQTDAVASIAKSPANALLLGVTGSGKSRVYLSLRWRFQSFFRPLETIANNLTRLSQRLWKGHPELGFAMYALKLWLWIHDLFRVNCVEL